MGIPSSLQWAPTQPSCLIFFFPHMILPTFWPHPESVSQTFISLDVSVPSLWIFSPPRELSFFAAWNPVQCSRLSSCVSYSGMPSLIFSNSIQSLLFPSSHAGPLLLYHMFVYPSVRQQILQSSCSVPGLHQAVRILEQLVRARPRARFCVHISE